MMAINKIKKVVPGEPERVVPPQPDRIIEEVEGVICDICGKVSDEVGEWGTEPYSVEKVKIRRTSGFVYPDSVDKTISTFHVCPSCWDEHIEPFFASFGAAPTIEEY